MLELYHGLVSTASERARLVLEEKGLSWISPPVDLFNGGQHRPEYRALNPMGQVPTLVHDGFALRESSVIAGQAVAGEDAGTSRVQTRCDRCNPIHRD